MGTKEDYQPSDPDVALMLEFKAGNEAAFRALYEKYKVPMLTYAYRYMRSRAAAEEAAQEIFLKVYRSGRSFEPRAKFRTWLYKIATNHCLNELRRAEYRQDISSLDAQAETGQGGGRTPQVADKTSPSQAELLEREQTLKTVAGALRDLAPNQRAAFMLSRVEGFSYSEIADALGLSVPAVKSLLNRAKDALLAKLGLQGAIEVQR